MENENVSKKKAAESFAAMADLNRFFALVELGEKPTLAQAQDAVNTACKIYQFNSEEEILNCGNSEFIEFFQEVKAKILGCVTDENATGNAPASN